MVPFDPNKYKSKISTYIEIADANIKQAYESEFNNLKGLSQEQIEDFGGTTSQMNQIIKEVENAKDKNLKQSALIENLKKLGQSTYDLARKVSVLVP